MNNLSIIICNACKAKNAFEADEAHFLIQINGLCQLRKLRNRGLRILENFMGCTVCLDIEILFNDVIKCLRYHWPN